MKLDIIVLELQEGINFRTKGLKNGKVKISIFTEEEGKDVQKITIGEDDLDQNIKCVEFYIEKRLCFKTCGLENGVIMLQAVKNKEDY